MKTKKDWSKCVICGTPVHPWRRHAAKTCSNFCTEIKKTGKTRDQLVREDSLNFEIEKQPEQTVD
jgi:predicted nucleic acid-binding Zn ribbon protein